MVIPQYPPPVTGGMERQAHELSKALVAQGVGVLVLSGQVPGGEPAAREFEGVPIVRIPFPRWKWLRFPWTGLAILIAMIRHRSRFDVVHVHNPSWYGTFSLLTAKALRKPVLAKLPTGFDWAFPTDSVRLRTFLRCDALAVLSGESADDFCRRGFPEERIFKITNGVSVDRFAPPKAERPLEPDLLRVLFMGRLETPKGITELLDVWPSVVAQCQHRLLLVLCGTGPLEDEIRAQIDRAGMHDKVTLLGHISDVASELRRADVFVLPSHIEGNSNAVLEAMATGLPVVSTRAGGTPLLVGPEGAEWLVEPRDGLALQDRLVRLLNDEVTRRRLGEAMLARIRSHLTIEVVAQRYRAVYTSLPAGPSDRVGSASSPIFSER